VAQLRLNLGSLLLLDSDQDWQSSVCQIQNGDQIAALGFDRDGVALSLRPKTSFGSPKSLKKVNTLLWKVEKLFLKTLLFNVRQHYIKNLWSPSFNLVPYRCRFRNFASGNSGRQGASRRSASSPVGDRTARSSPPKIKLAVHIADRAIAPVQLKFSITQNCWVTLVLVQTIFEPSRLQLGILASGSARWKWVMAPVSRS